MLRWWGWNKKGRYCMDRRRGGWNRMMRRVSPSSLGRFVPFKANAVRRHHIPKQHHRATNSVAYDAALRHRGSLAVRFTAAMIADWKAAPRTTQGG